jgi:O-antigen ligase
MRGINSTNSALSVYSIGIFFLFMLVMPTTLQTERGLGLIVLVLFSFIALLMGVKSWRISGQIITWLLVVCCTSLFAMLNGAIEHAPGALAVAGVYVVWPIIFTWFIGFSSRIETYTTLVNTLLIGVFLASLIGFIVVVSGFAESLDFFRPLFEFLGARAGISEDGIELTIPSMAAVIYGFCFLIAYFYAFPRSDVNSGKNQHRLFLLFLLILSLVALLISGKRGFWLSAILAFPYTFFVCHIAGIRRFSIKSTLPIIIMMFIVIVLGFVIIAFLLEINYQDIVDSLITGFNFTDQSNSSAFRRYTQFNALLDGWMKSPLIGAGHGAMASDKQGNELQPWAYELQYLALLFQLGIVGFLVYVSSVLWLVYQMVSLSKRYSDLARLLIPMTVGLLSFLTMNATNPYLGKFDYLWVIFLPLGVVNVGLLREQSYKAATKAW